MPENKGQSLARAAAEHPRASGRTLGGSYDNVSSLKSRAEVLGCGPLPAIPEESVLVHCFHSSAVVNRARSSRDAGAVRCC